MIQSMLLRTGPSGLGHPDEVLAVHERILAVSPAQGRDIKVGAGRRVHVIEAGEGPPVVLLHGSSTSSLLLLPLLERLKGLRGIVVDRPGFGLSDPARVSRERFRDAAAEFLDEVLDELELTRSRLQAARWVGPGPCGTPWPAPIVFVSSYCSARPRCCPAPVSRRPCE